MNSWLQVFLNGLLCIAAIEVQRMTQSLVDRLAEVRWTIASSGERCPAADKSDCHLVISARSYGRWQACDENHPPSGADLPMHRWFRVTGRCPIDVGPFKFALAVPEQLVYR